VVSKQKQPEWQPIPNPILRHAKGAWATAATVYISSDLNNLHVSSATHIALRAMCNTLSQPKTKTKTGKEASSQKEVQ